MKTKFHYECTNCGKEYSEAEVKYLCPLCDSGNSSETPPKGVLKTVYNYKELLKTNIGFDALSQSHFIDLLPINSIKSLPQLNIGGTPLYSVNKIDDSDLGFKLYLKDDSQNPTYSFKDRASALVSAFAKENNLNTIVAASTGNAGSSLAGICASQNQKAIILVPEKAPLAKLTQIIMYGASTIPIKGTYDDAFELSIKASREFGWYNRNTAFNPLTIEGKKTVAFELFEQLNCKTPDHMFVPVGDGAIISGVYKGFEDLLKLKIIDKMPLIVAVQAEGSDNLIRNIDNESFEVKPSSTIADSISVDVPRNFYMAKKYISKYNGEYLSLSDKEILTSSSVLSKNTGLFAEPAAAAAFAGLLKYKNDGKLKSGSDNVVLLTGSGLKDIKAINPIIEMPQAIEPQLDNIKHLLL
jgi:threonine synthase